MVVSLSYGVVFFGTSIFFLMLLFSILATDNQKGMTLMTHICKTRPIFLLIFLGLFNAELRGLIHVKFERSTAVTMMPATMPPPGPALLQSQKLLAAGNAAAQTDEEPHPGEPVMKLDQRDPAMKAGAATRKSVKICVRAAIATASTTADSSVLAGAEKTPWGA
ncbi:hypothetical protein HPB50_004069 [Hyalomma asiaticum]|uniref:Uncharacterized protein n=1 Tax=Hyalomma asiaticum TaxID=266040 RepID=A0ACB7SSH5_HYAAI|nr:hypothetical protein HPB50_004069 [Hyalomma asiaticum]